MEWEGQGLKEGLLSPKKGVFKTPLEAGHKIPQNENEQRAKVQENPVVNEPFQEPATYLIPPWLRNSLGLTSTKSNEVHRLSKSNRLVRRFKERNQNEIAALKANLQEDSRPKMEDQIEDMSRSKTDTIQVCIGQETDLVEILPEPHGKLPSMQWSRPFKQTLKEVDVMSQEFQMRPNKTEVTSIDVVMALEQQKMSDEEKRKAKMRKQKLKSKRRISEDALKTDLEILLERKAREIIEAYFKKENNSAVAETMVGSINGKRPMDLRDQGRRREETGKLLESMNESALVDLISKKPDVLKKLIADKHRHISVDEKHGRKSEVSTDDENDIKRLSDFLTHSTNPSEKRKYLEQVRNYFEKKRWSRLEKRFYIEDKLGSEEDKDCTNIPLEINAVSENDKKLPNHELFVEKAVSEIIEKFTERYHIEIPAEVINEMKKSIMLAIQTGCKQKVEEKQNVDGISLIFELKDEEDDGFQKQIPEPQNNRQVCVFTAEENLVTRDSVPDLKKSAFKTLLERPEAPKTELPTKEKDFQLENATELKRDLELCLATMQIDVDLTGLKLCSLVLAKPDENGMSLERIVYNYAKNGDSFMPVENVSIPGADGDKPAMKHIESQTEEKFEQTLSIFLHKQSQTTVKKFQDQNDQTKEKKADEKQTQTEFIDLSIKKNTKTNLVPGLYRVVNASEEGHFYFYPVNVDTANPSSTAEEQRDKCEKPEEIVFTTKGATAETCSKEKIENFETSATENESSISGPKPEITTKSSRCSFTWNGREIDPGSDLKIHVEDLVTKKLEELIIGNQFDRKKVNNSGEQLDLNIKLVGSNGRFSFSKPPEVTPFIFAADLHQWNEKGIQVVDYRQRESDFSNDERSQTAKPCRKLRSRCSTEKSKHRKHCSVQRSSSDTKRKSSDGDSFAIGKKVSETKKVKLEMQKENQCNLESVKDFCSHVSNASSNSTLAEVPVKLRSEGNQKKCGRKSLSNLQQNIKRKEHGDWEEKKIEERQRAQNRNWRIIENVLTRVSEKEQEMLWNDIKDFVKSKIGRDISDEGAREVCIEIEQDVPKHRKGKKNQSVVAKGNYSKNDGDIEVEVDLTLDDLEKLLRHRQKKWRKRPTADVKCEVKASSSSVMSDKTTDEVFKYQTFLNSSRSVTGDQISQSEWRMLKERRK